MTRINVIPVSELWDQHLLAEHREIKRIPNCIAQGKYSLEGQPQVYTLGKGHVKFFYDKLTYLNKRYKELYNECLKRGFNVQNYESAFRLHLSSLEMFTLYNDYIPTPEAIELNRERINSKYKPDFYKFYGKKVLQTKNNG